MLSDFSQATEKGLEGLSESVRLEMREYAQKSLYFLNKAIIGFKDFSPKLHKELCAHVQNPTWNRKLILVPRNHFKSSAVTIGYPIFLLINDPEERILISNATATNAQHFLRRIKAVFERNVAFRWLFPELIPKDFRKTKWNETEMLINRKTDFPEASVEAIGLGGVVTSRHYTVHIKDDLIDEKTVLTQENLEKIIEWHKYSESLLQSPVHSKEIVIGTRYHEGDVYGFIIENEPNYHVYQRAAIENGEPIFPEKFTLEALENIRRKQGSTIFSCQYMNQPYNPEDRVFKSFELFTEIPRGLTYFITTDFAAKADELNDDSVLVVSGFDQNGKEWVVDVVMEKLTPDQQEKILIEKLRQWKPINVRLEEVAFQNVQNFYLRKAIANEGIKVAIIPMKRSSETKASRILRLQPRFEQKMICFYIGLQRLEDLRNQVMRYPKVLHDDFLDALADQEENGQLFGFKPPVETSTQDSLKAKLARLEEGSRRYWESKLRGKEETPNYMAELVC
jgi:predicted phage terminase large subunit-like protein